MPNSHLQDDPSNLGQSLEQAKSLLERAIALLGNEHCAEAANDLSGIPAVLKSAATRLSDAIDDIVCIECGDYSAGGEGYDGRCGSCADRACNEDGDEFILTDAEEVEGDLVASVTYATFHLEDADEYRGVIFNGTELQATTRETYGSSDEAMAATRRLHVGDETVFLDGNLIEQDPTDPSSSYDTVFYDDEDKFRGVWLVDGEIRATTQLLYWTPAAARHAARTELKECAE